jgi:hypothetical protein
MNSLSAAPDLTFPPDPFEHGPCSEPGCPNPAIFAGGVCANHVKVLKVDTAIPVGPHRWNPAEYAQRKARRKAARQSKKRNRR